MKKQEKNPASDLPGFDLPNKFDPDDDEIPGLAKKTKAKGSSGGFQAMGLSFPILKGITKRGYKIPTPVQRKTIPLILEGRDVVAMAKTGSGKTACFLIPLFEKLQNREPTVNARALILSPTRELAIQTFKFIKDLGKFLNLKTVLVLGGDPINAQFSAIHTCPDVIVATPGRFLHLCVEMDLKLSSVQYVVFDEADRLFEMGFGEQLSETLNRLPESKQMVMFSATLPKLLVDFAKAGLNDPVLIRLDVDSKLPEKLELKFIHVRPEERYSSLICLLKYIIPQDAQTVVFVGTQHHVDLVSYLLDQAKVSNTVIYSSMDASARKINTAKFQLQKVSVLIVTDVAARGIDIPSLDYVVNVHFPGKPKLFVHRVGRCARAGRQGTAYSLVSTDDEAHLLDLYLFLNRTFDINKTSEIGSIPQDILETEHASVLESLANEHISGIHRTSVNAYKKYINTRPAASADSNKRVKLISFNSLAPLDDFTVYSNGKVPEEKKHDIKFNLMAQMKNYRPSGTIFELNPNQKSTQFEVMKNKRKAHRGLIENFQEKKSSIILDNAQNSSSKTDVLAATNASDIEATFSTVIAPKKRESSDSLYKKSKKLKKARQTSSRDSEYYVPYQSSDKHTEDGLAINNFGRQAQAAELSITTAGDQEVKHRPGQKKWDRLRKKMVAVENPRNGKIRTESGVWIPATYKTGRYAEWKEKTKIEEQVHSEFRGEHLAKSHEDKYPVARWKRHMLKQEMKGRLPSKESELKNTDQIVRERLRLELIRNREKVNKKMKDVNRKRTAKKQNKRRN